jgi:hypothetical protein
LACKGYELEISCSWTLYSYILANGTIYNSKKNKKIWILKKFILKIILPMHIAVGDMLQHQCFVWWKKINFSTNPFGQQSIFNSSWDIFKKHPNNTMNTGIWKCWCRCSRMFLGMQRGSNRWRSRQKSAIMI